MEDEKQDQVADADPNEQESVDLQSTNTLEADQDKSQDQPTEQKPKTPWYKNKKILLVIFGLVIVGALLALFFVSSGDDQESEESVAVVEVKKVEATLTYVDGDVESYQDESWVAIEEDSTLEEGAMLRTAEGSRAAITFSDDSLIRIDQNSEVELVNLDEDSMVISNLNGVAYSRVSSNEGRSFEVNVEEQTYKAVGTAYITINKTDQSGAQVYEGSVNNKKTDILEGEAIYSKTKDGSDVDTIVKLDPSQLSADEFLLWNKEQDSKNEMYKDKLGVLKDVVKPQPQEPEAEPAPADPAAGISASAQSVDDGVKVSWLQSGLGSIDGFKVVYSKTSNTPTYGVDSSKYVSADSTSAKLDLTNGKTYYIRVCAYKSDGSCSNYSSTVTATAPTVSTPASLSISSGSDSISCSGTFNLYSHGNVPYYDKPNGSQKGTKPAGKLTGSCASNEGWFKTNGVYILGNNLHKNPA